MPCSVAGILSPLLMVIAAGLVLFLALAGESDPPSFAQLLGHLVAAVGLGLLLSASLGPALGVILVFLPLLLLSEGPLPLLGAGALLAAMAARFASQGLTIPGWRVCLALALALALAGYLLAGPALALLLSVALVWPLLLARLLSPGPGRAARSTFCLLNTVCGHGTFVGLCLLLPLLSPLLLLLPGRRLILAWLLRLGARITLASPPALCWRHSVDAAADEDGAPAVVLSNHLSVLDILTSLGGAGRLRSIVAKPWVFASPILGPAARLGGMIPVEGALSADPPSDWDVVVFAEGSRSPDGSTKRMRRGALALAQRWQRPLRPLIQVGTYRALAPRQLWIRPGLLRSHFLPAEPLPPPAHERAWLRDWRQRAEAISVALRARDLGHPWSRLDRWEACAHRGWRLAWAWLRAEGSGLWRVAAALPEEACQIHGDASGVLHAARVQLRPWQAFSSGDCQVQLWLPGTAVDQLCADAWWVLPAPGAEEVARAQCRRLIPVPESAWALLAPSDGPPP
ncbi:MAG: 1-acyl-sn-glycerol-3-phosphate acyltransferase [Planctomycetota bacterium]|nr:MAG: 1-acyl-sn-glycerol-3-phosphate acyltransferase [Planctomycetota bacterium]